MGKARTKFQTIDGLALATVTGSAGYTYGDVTRGVVAGGLGFLGGGPIGGVIGFGAGLMSRNVSELGDGLDKMSQEQRRSQELDKKRRQLQGR